MLELMGMDDVIAGGEKEREGKGGGGGGGGGGAGVGGGAEKGRTRVDKLPTLPQESIWTPRSPQRSQGDSALHPHYKRAVAVTGDCGAAIWLYCSVTQPVIYPHCLQSSWKRHTQ